MRTALICLLLTFFAAKTGGAEKSWTLVYTQGVMNFVHMDSAHWKDQDQYRLAIGKICAGKAICQVLFWKDRALAPKRLPMSDAQVAAKVAHWQYNGNTGLRRFPLVLQAREGTRVLLESLAGRVHWIGQEMN